MAKRGFQGAVMRSFGARDHQASVVGTELLAPHFLRIRMVSETLFSEAEVAPTAWLRFWFPDPDGKDIEHQRAYTISAADPATGHFAVDMVLHQPAGPASAWGVAAKPGDVVSLNSLGSSKFELPDELPTGYLLIGDSASIPGISGILQTIPGEVPIELYLEEHDPADRLIPLPGHPRLRTHWVPRRGPESLAAAIEPRDWSNWYAWVAPESASLKHLRTRLREEFGFPKSELYPQAYWIEGRAMGKLRSQPEERASDQRPAVAKTPKPTEPSHAEASGELGASPRAAASSGPAGDQVPTVAGHRASQTPADIPAPSTTSPTGPERTVTGEPTTRGSWRAQAAGRLLAPLRSTLILAGVMQAFVTLLQLAPFVLLVELARLLLAGAESAQLWTIGLWAVGLMGLGVVLSTGLLLWLHAVDAQFERDLRQRLLGKLAKLPLGWFDSRTSGQVKQLIQDDTLALHYLVTHAVPDAVAAVVAPIAVLAYLFAVDWRIALALFIPVLVYIVTMWVMMVQSGGKISRALRWTERMNSEAGSYLEGQPVVRVFGGAAASTFRARLGEYIDFLNAWQRPFVRQKTLMDLVTRPATGLLLIMLVGTLLITAGSLNPVSLLPFLMLGTTFGARLLGIGYGLSGLRTGMLAARRVQVALDEAELSTRAAAPERPSPHGQVEFTGVGFAYRPGVPVLSDVTLTLEPGTVTALVGPSGSGKSTLAALLARFHDVSEGAIRIGGRDVRELTADELYTRVGFVFQQTQLVRGTVAENIALARPDATAAQIEEAARAAQIHDRILRLPEGYRTVLGPEPALSGGERQRLSIARAILADTPVLVLDEATAFADPESEYLVQQALNRLSTGRTVLVIAHRLHTVTGVDRIVVLDHGRVVETGRHEELLELDGRYRQLWQADAAHGLPVGGVR